jgi:hypothetical protein
LKLASLVLGVLLAGLGLISRGDAQAFSESSLKPLAMNLDGVGYFGTAFFADAVAQGGEWREFTLANFDFGTSIPSFGQTQFDVNGYPKYLNAGKGLKLLLTGLHAGYGNRPATWPAIDALADGKIVVEWTGDADIQLNNATFLPNESSGDATGRLVNGRRVYHKVAATGMWMNVVDVNPANPITGIHAWLPDPADPQNVSLEGRLFHPTFLSRLAEGDWGFLRMVDWGATQGNPQQDWSDRRLPTHVFQAGILNPRAPANGAAGNRETGVAFEHMVALSNAANRDIWINVPHLATNDFITKLAQTIRFGSDGVNPYTSEQSNPVHAPLNPGLRVFVEYSNEIWSGGFAFPQGDWAQAQAQAAGISRPQFNARRFCEVWRLFEIAFGGHTRLVRPAAVFTGDQGYTSAFLTEMKSYCPTLSPPQEPDVISPTTYFGNGIQDWAFQKAKQQAGTGDPWFFTTGSFDAGGGALRPVSLPGEDPYWLGSAVLGHVDQTFDKWKRLILSGATQTGAGPDATGIGGGFDFWLRDLALNTFATRKPIVTYEGGPSIYTNDKDGGDIRDDGITTFMEMLNRQPQIADVYRIHLNMALAKGLRTQTAYSFAGRWGLYGQWGHLETITQPTTAAPKWKFLHDWKTEVVGLRHIDDVLGTAPQFLTPATLPTVAMGQPYSVTIATAGGEGTRTVEIIGQALGSGLSVSVVGDQAVISGTPTTTGDNFVYLRVKDGDNDPAWRTFSFRTVGGPHVLLESNFEGTDPNLENLPWTPFYTKKPNLIYTGWNKGAGTYASFPRPQTRRGLVYAHIDEGDPAQNTLARAIAEQKYVTTSIQAAAGETLNLRNAEVRFTIQRADSWASPKQFVVMTSVGGFAVGNEVFTTPPITDAVDTEVVFHLPDTAAYERLTAPVEFRLLSLFGIYAWKNVTLQAFKITSANTPPTAATSTANVASGGTFTLTLPFSVTDADGDAVTVQNISASSGALFSLGTVNGNTVTVNGTSGATGKGTISFTVSDGFGGLATGSVVVKVSTPLALGASQRGAITTPGQEAAFNFVAISGQPLSLQIASPAFTPVGTTMTVSVFGPSGQLVWSGNGTTGIVQALSNLPGGSYAVLVSVPSPATGTFDITVGPDSADVPVPAWALFLLATGLLSVATRRSRVTARRT